MNMHRAAEHFGLMLTALRGSGLAITLSDAATATLIRDALAIIDPTDEGARNAAEDLRLAFDYMLDAAAVSSDNGENPL